MTSHTLTPHDRAAMRKKLLAAGIKTAGMTDAQITEAAAAIPAGQTAPEAPAPEAPAPKPPAAPEAPADAPEAPSTGTPDVTPADTLAAAIDAAMKAAAAATSGPIDEAAVIALIEKHTTRREFIEHHVTIDRPDSPGKTITGAHAALADTLDVFAIGENAYLVGPAGSGKTTLAAQAAEALETNFHFTGAVIDKFELLGFVDAAGAYHETELYRWMKNGGVFLFDEVDSSYPAPLNAFNALLENGWIVFPNGERLDVDRDRHYIVAAANTVGTGANRSYVGRFELDRAFLDRFVQLTVNYDEAIERQMALDAWTAAGGPEESKAIAENWADAVREFRALLDARRIIALCTPRATRRGAKLLARGWSVDKVKQAELYKHLSGDQLQQLNIKEGAS